MINKKPQRGFRDFFPEQKRIRDYLFSIMEKTAHQFGYESYDGPLIEEVALYQAKSGQELINDQIYSFTDRGERFVAIRPEMTPTLARMVSQVHRQEPKPLRWFSIPNLLRYEKPQRGRVREHWQLNCDIFGAPSEKGEQEIIQLLIQLLHNFGATSEHFSLLLNDRRLIDELFQKKLELSVDQSLKLYKIIDKMKKVSLEKFSVMLEELELTAKKLELLKDYLSLKNWDELQQFQADYSFEQGTELFNLYHHFKKLGLDHCLTFDPSIVRGLDYYTGVVFEVFDQHPDNRRAICGGGAYAGLMQLFGEDPLPGVGFGLGDVTLKDFLESHKLIPPTLPQQCDLMLTTQVEEGLQIITQLAQTLRGLGLRVLTSLEPLKFKKIFPLAERKSIPYVGLLGDDEIKEGVIKIKNLKNRKQKIFNISHPQEIIDFFS